VIANDKHDQIELNHISHESPQSGKDASCSISTRESH